MPTLNVIFHGLFAVVEEPYRLVAAVPAIKDHQEYLIGIEVNGTPQPRLYGRGTFELLGVTPLSKVPGATVASFPPDKNAKLRGAGAIEVLTTSPPARSVFILPRPENVVSCYCYNSGTDVVFTGRDAWAITSQQFAAINILSYTFNHLEDLEFAGLPSLEFAFSDDTRQYVNLGILSQGAHDGSSAVSAAFDKMMADLFPDKEIHLVQKNPSATPSVSCTGVPGITARTFFQLLQIQLNAAPDDCVGLVIDNT